MQVTLNQTEIETAIITYVGNQGISTIGKHTDVTLIAGRSPNGMTASINITDKDVDTSIPTPRKAIPSAHDTITVVDVTDEPTPEDEPEEITAQRPLFGN